MTTDLEQLLAWIKRVDVPYQYGQDLQNDTLVVEIGHYCSYNDIRYEECFRLIEQVTDGIDNEKVDGYSSFYHSFVFDLNGKFIRSGSWE